LELGELGFVEVKDFSLIGIAGDAVAFHELGHGRRFFRSHFAASRSLSFCRLKHGSVTVFHGPDQAFDVQQSVESDDFDAGCGRDGTVFSPQGSVPPRARPSGSAAAPGPWAPNGSNLGPRNVPLPSAGPLDCLNRRRGDELAGSSVMSVFWPSRRYAAQPEMAEIGASRPTLAWRDRR
jgi:hypothetical protein